MSNSKAPRDDERVLVLAPTPQDAALSRSLLAEAGMTCHPCADLNDLCHELEAGAGAILVTEEALAGSGSVRLTEALGRQPQWSEVPILLLAGRGADSPLAIWALEALGNVTILEQPVRRVALVSALRTAVTARHRQYELRDRLQSRAFLAALVEFSEDAIIGKDLNGIIISWNPGAEHLFGYTADETLGRSITLIIPPERQGEEQSILERLRRGERVEHFETERIRKDGRRVDISLTISPIRDATGRVVAASKVARDITHAKMAEEALRASEERFRSLAETLKRADRLKDEFLATLAHELRNPLAPIRSSLQILRLSGSDAPQRERLVEMIERQVNHLVRLVDDLLEVSRITTGKIELRKESVELTAVVRSAVEASKPFIEAGRHRLALRLPPRAVRLEADPVRLSQVIGNLLTNAAKYTEEGGQIWLTAGVEDSHVVVSVRDTGVGIAADMLPKVFEMFAQVDHPAGRTQVGLGIGLALVKNLVQLHGGTVEARSDGPGRGSEFIVRVPQEAPDRESAGFESHANQVSKAVSPASRILVVDDNLDAAESLSMLLRLMGHEVQTVHDGPAAIATALEYRPDVVLLDIGIPGLNGYEVAQRLRSDPDFEHVVLVALTGYGQDEDRRRSREAGFDEHLVKPVDVDVLRRLLSGRGSQRDASQPKR